MSSQEMSLCITLTFSSVTSYGKKLNKTTSKNVCNMSFKLVLERSRREHLEEIQNHRQS